MVMGRNRINLKYIYMKYNICVLKKIVLENDENKTNSFRLLYLNIGYANIIGI